MMIPPAVCLRKLQAGMEIVARLDRRLDGGGSGCLH